MGRLPLQGLRVSCWGFKVIANWRLQQCRPLGSAEVLDSAAIEVADAESTQRMNTHLKWNPTAKDPRNERLCTAGISLRCVHDLLNASDPPMINARPAFYEHPKQDSTLPNSSACAPSNTVQTTSHHNTYKPNPLLTFSFTILSYSSLFSLHIRAASTFAGLSSFGSASMLMTEMRIFSTLWIGLHRSDACS